MTELSESQYIRICAATFECTFCGAHRGQLCRTKDQSMVYDNYVHSSRRLEFLHFKKLFPAKFAKLCAEARTRKWIPVVSIVKSLMPTE